MLKIGGTSLNGGEEGDEYHISQMCDVLAAIWSEEGQFLNRGSVPIFLQLVVAE